MSLFKFEKAQKGDKVWSIKYGWGQISTIYPKNIYPIEVNFEINNKKSILRYFDFDGKESSDAINSSIFWNEFEIPKEAFKKPLPVLEIDTKVYIYINRPEMKLKGHFSHFDSQGKIHIFEHGRTSWTSTGKTTPSLKWELLENEKE